MKVIAADVFSGGFALGMQKRFDIDTIYEHTDYGACFSEQLGFNRQPFELSKQSHGDIIFSNPPCAVWSQLGSACSIEEKMADPRIDMTRDIAMLANGSPMVVAVESVPQILTKGKELVKEFIHLAEASGYALSLVKHNASSFGSCQDRRRVMVVFHRIELDFHVALTGPASPWSKLKSINPTEPKRHKYEKWFEKTKAGQRVRAVYKEEHPMGPAPSFLLKKIHPEEVCHTLLGHKTVHWDNRMLTPPEYAALMGWPAELVNGLDWGKRSHNTIVDMLTRGVCVEVGAWLSEVFYRGAQEQRPVAPEVNVVEVEA